MRLIQFRHNEQTKFGQVVDDSIRVLHPSKNLGLREFLSADARAAAVHGAHDNPEQLKVQDVDLLPPITDSSKIVCVGLNYHEHVAETGRQPNGYPTVFIRFADTQIGHRAPILLPTASHQLDFEGELAVVIGQRAYQVDEQQALKYVGGYACYNDVSVRDWQKHGTQWTPGKNFPGTGPFGPWIVTADEIPDPSALTIQTRLNGITVQSASTRQLIFSIPRLIAYISSFTALSPGDVICTGTPGGVGFTRSPPLFMKAGDTVEVEIERIGTLSNPVTSSGAASSPHRS